MKKTHIIALLLAVAGLLPAHADQADAKYGEGLKAVHRGDYAAADAAFREALRLRPNHANARYHLGQLKGQKKSIIARGRARELAKYTLDQIAIDGAELSEALVAIQMMVEKESDKKFTPNFVIQDPSNQLGERRVTLNVKSVPANAVLDMLASQAGATVKFEEHAIILKPRAGSAAR